MGGCLNTAHCREAHILVLASVGNLGDESWHDPVAMCTAYDPVTTPDKLLDVGSTTSSDKLSDFSSYGACVHVQVVLPRRPIAQRPTPLPPPPRPPVHARPPACPPTC